MRKSTLKKNLFKFLIVVFSGSIVMSSFGQMSQVSSTVSMGPGYANDVYYSMENGVVGEADRLNWDIAFTTRMFDFNIILNDVHTTLWTYPNGTIDDWESVDTAGLSTWTSMLNDENYWEYGAFSLNALGHPDYGWGVYNSIDHNIYGDSLFIIKVGDAYKKLAIVMQNSMQRSYNFKYADLDGSNEVEETLVAGDYDTKNFIYYSIASQEVVDREPASETWDLVFTRWVDNFFFESMGFFQPITGVFTNFGVAAGELRNFDVTGDTCYMDAAYNYEDEENPDNRITIGGDWKHLDFSTFTYYVDDSLVYFVESQEGNLYKIEFVEFGGSSNGNFVFYQNWIEPLPAPTDPVVDDNANTFGWTYVEGYLDPAYYHYSIDSGATWTQATANPVQLENLNYPIGYVQVMLTDEDNCALPSEALLSDAPFTDATSVSDIAGKDLFRTYPNPVNDQLHIDVQTNQSVHIQLFDLVGKVVFDNHFENANQIRIPVGELNKGMYILSVGAGTYLETQKIIKN